MTAATSSRSMTPFPAAAKALIRQRALDQARRARQGAIRDCRDQGFGREAQPCLPALGLGAEPAGADPPVHDRGWPDPASRPGDRVQFTATDRKPRYRERLLGTVETIAGDLITVRADNDQTSRSIQRPSTSGASDLLARFFSSQGRTHAQVYCLYDHAYAWGIEHVLRRLHPAQGVGPAATSRANSRPTSRLSPGR